MWHLWCWSTTRRQIFLASLARDINLFDGETDMNRITLFNRGTELFHYNANDCIADRFTWLRIGADILLLLLLLWRGVVVNSEGDIRDWARLWVAHEVMVKQRDAHIDTHNPNAAFCQNNLQQSCMYPSNLSTNWLWRARSINQLMIRFNSHRMPVSDSTDSFIFTCIYHVKECVVTK